MIHEPILQLPVELPGWHLLRLRCPSPVGQRPALNDRPQRRPSTHFHRYGLNREQESMQWKAEEPAQAKVNSCEPASTGRTSHLATGEHTSVQPVTQLATAGPPPPPQVPQHKHKHKHPSLLPRGFLRASFPPTAHIFTCSAYLCLACASASAALSPRTATVAAVPFFLFSPCSSRAWSCSITTKTRRAW